MVGDRSSYAENSRLAPFLRVCVMFQVIFHLKIGSDSRCQNVVFFLFTTKTIKNICNYILFFKIIDKRKSPFSKIQTKTSKLNILLSLYRINPNRVETEKTSHKPPRQTPTDQLVVVSPSEAIIVLLELT